MGFSLPAICWVVLIAAAAWAGAPLRAAEKVDRFQQAKHLLAKGDFDAAIARLDEAIRLEPKQAKYHGLRGVAWLRKGDYAKGAADLKAAVASESRRRGPALPPLERQPAVGRSPCPRRKAGGPDAARPAGDGPSSATRRSSSAIGPRKFAGEDFVELDRLGSLAAAAFRRRAPRARQRRERRHPGRGPLHLRAERGQAAAVRGALGRCGLRVAQRQLRPRVRPAERRSRSRPGVERGVRRRHL